MKNHIKYIVLLVAALPLMLGGCDDMLDIDDPTDRLSADAAYSSVDGIKAAEAGLYTENFQSNSLYWQLVDLYFPMFSDEVTSSLLASWIPYYSNDYGPSTGMMQTFWLNAYKSIYISNDFLTRIAGTTLIDATTLRAYEGEAKYFRAYCYMLLTGMYGDVPLVLTNDYSVAATLPRAPQADVYAQIEADLKSAQEGLRGFGNSKTHITEYAATALLARAYLYEGKWQAAADEASKLIPTADGGQGEGGFKLEAIGKVFKSSSEEAISQLNSEGLMGSGRYVGYASITSMWLPSGPITLCKLTDTLVDDLKADPQDKRMSWIDSVGTGSRKSYYPCKYKNKSTPSSTDDYEYFVYLRLAEQYLIRAEANARLGNTAAAVADLNVIRQRAGVAALGTSLGQDELLLAIEEERRKELFCEQGHRWFDLARTGRADAVYSRLDYKTGWKSYKTLMPVPEKEILGNPNLTQNPGYDNVEQ